MEKKKQGRPKKVTQKSDAIYPGGLKGIQPEGKLAISDKRLFIKDEAKQEPETLEKDAATTWAFIPPEKVNGLYPCPFCGSIEIHQTYINRDTEKLKYCNRCGYLGPTAPTYEKAVELWNEAIENKAKRIK